MKLFITLVTIFAMTLSGFGGNSGAAEKSLPFHPGEKLRYDLRWTIIKAGEATLEVLPFETINGVRAYHFAMMAKSTSFVDVFYKIRDRIDAYADTDMTRSVFYRKKQREGKTHRDIEVSFDWKKKEARYSNFGNKRDPVPLPAGAFDPLSAFFHTRFMDFRENMVIERPVTDGKKCIIGKVTVIRREKTEAGGKIWDTWLLEPELKHIGGVFEKSRDTKIQLWVTADTRRIPVKIKSKVVVGSFTGELVSAEWGKMSQSEP